jgi:hypothetical protein
LGVAVLVKRSLLNGIRLRARVFHFCRMSS